MVLKTPGGELNGKLIQLDFEVTLWLQASRNTVWQGGKKLPGVGRGNVTRKRPKLCRFRGVSLGLPFITSSWF